MSEKEKEEEKNWSELPSELLHLIAKKLPDVLYFVRFRAVCKTWRSSAPLSDPPHQLPWLLEYTSSRGKHRTGLTKRQRYYSVSSGKTLTIPVKNRKQGLDLEWWRDQGYCSKYLTFADYSNTTLHFLNPLSRDRFSIHCTSAEWPSFDPHINKSVAHKGVFYDRCVLEQLYFPTLESCPADMSHECSHLNRLQKLSLNEVIYKYQLYKNENVSPRLRKSFLIESSQEQGLLRVLWFHDWHIENSVKFSVFHIYRLDSQTADGKPCWVRIADIGNQIIFLEKKNGFSLTARPSNRFRQGCIYFIYPQEGRPYEYDVLTGTVEKMPCPFKWCTWFLPGL
ncbi:hypothetical protein LUZ61_000160 [Rhynchospora tenuis]|uniref:F-box domain-containing protein n=1 Tax=Rhynchospora tenuis TaxID=198213 RepID=A0AAD5ZEJ2_9POAL|nr:hypothetical protein LUZ61_000160 [Rhynchospora tenuis]